MRETRASNVAVMSFLFSDVEGSTRLLERFPRAQPLALLRHDEILTAAVLDHGGSILETVGDGFFIAFRSATDAVGAALDAQLAFGAEDWGEVGEIRVRMALHTGEAERRGDNFAGPPLYRCARLLALAHGGQVLLSRATATLVRDSLPPEASLRSMGEHRLRDLLEPEEVFQLHHPDLRADFPPLKSVDMRPNNLPAELTALVGRERERAEIARLLEQGRLVTITGPGGVGKTRLALAVGSDQLSSFRHGIFLVDLSSVDAPEQVAPAIGRALHVAEPRHDGSHDAESDEAAWLEEIRAFLREKQMLLILDNFEQVVAAGPLAAELLTACPRLKILVTSQHSLRVSGEYEFSLPPLALPATRGSAESNAAVDLFVRRAQAVRPSFGLTPQNAPVVAEICRRLDGLPLAIELAAARVKLLQPSELLARLGGDSDPKALGFLTAGRQDASARHQTLRDAIEWSYRLLTREEQRLFGRLATFVGGWTVDAAEAICGDHDLDVMETLASLLDKSLVRSVEGTDDASRYAMLGVIRQFALERLYTSAEAATIAVRHAHYYADLAEAAEPGLTGPEQGRTLHRLGLEHLNLQAALRLAAERGDGETGLRLAGALWRFWLGSGRVAEGFESIQRALRGSEACAPALRAKALSGAGNLAFQRGNLDLAATYHEECLALRRQVNDTAGVAGTLNNLGLIAWQRGDTAAAQRLYEESLTAYRSLNHRYGMALVLSNLGILASRDDDAERARSLYEESLALRRELEDQQGTAISLQNLADLALKRGDRATAADLLFQALALYRDLEDARGLAYALDALGSLAVQANEPERGARLFGAAEALRKATGAALLPAELDQHARDTTAMRLALGPDGYAAAFDAGAAMSLDAAIAYALREGEPAREPSSVHAT